MKIAEKTPILHFEQYSDSEFDIYPPFHSGIEGFDSSWAVNDWYHIAKAILAHIYDNDPICLILPDGPLYASLYSDFENREFRLLSQIIEVKDSSRRVWFAFVDDLNDSFWDSLFNTTEFMMDAVLMTDLPQIEINIICEQFAYYWGTKEMLYFSKGNWADSFGDGYGLHIKLQSTKSGGFAKNVESIATQSGWRFCKKES